MRRRQAAARHRPTLPQEGFGRAAPCTCSMQRQWQRQRQRQKQLWLSAGWAGRCGWAGHAVPPPLRGPAQPLAAVRSGACEAVLRNKSALTHGGQIKQSCPPTPPHPTHAADGGCRPLVGTSVRYRNSKQNQSSCRPTVGTHQSRTPFRQIAENCRRRGGSGGGSVRGMDAAAKPPWTGLRRLPPPDPPRHPSGNQLLTLMLTLLRPLRVQGAALQRAPYLNRPFCVKSQTSFRLAGSAAAVRFPPGPPATRVRPLRPPPLRRRSSRIPACASCRLHPILAARFTGTLRVSRSV